MNRVTFLLILTLLLLSTACGANRAADEIVVTPPVVAAPTMAPPVVAAPTLAPPTAVPPSATPDATAAPLPTDMPTPTAEPSPTPTPMPVPETAVDAIRLLPILESGLSKPTALTHAFDARLFVTEQVGRIRIIADGQLLPQPFLDISDRVGSSSLEQGLLSVAFHPRYGENGRFFVNYTDRGGNTRVASFQVDPNDPNRADPASEQILLTINQPYANHNGGQLQFGPDGLLYIGTGDGGSANDPLNAGQDLGTLLGKLLRIDVDSNPGGYAIPASNPFVNDDAARNEIWAWGLRNPWRFSFDRLTGDLFIADVGQNQWEEINFQPAKSGGGENYGWRIMEASHCFRTGACDAAGLILPIFEYDHSQGCSVTGGYLYRGAQYPALTGNYFLADYCRGSVWRLFPAGDGAWAAAKVLETGRTISSFGEDVEGEVYLLDYVAGGVWQIASSE